MSNNSAYESKIISADRLQRSNIQKKALGDYITDIERYLEGEIKKAHNEGKPCLITTIPSTFSVSNMTNKDAQIYIWAKLIVRMEKQGYRITLSPKKDSCLIKVKWKPVEEEQEHLMHREILFSHIEQNMTDD